MLPIFKLGLGFKIASGQQAFTWVSLRDVIRAIQFIMETPALNHAINILSPQIITQEKFAESLAAALKRPLFLTFPTPIIKFLFGQMGEELLLSGTVAKPQKLLECGFKFIDTDIDETLKNLIRMSA
jgi:NAD dependent epimerase/dehydratase family enzyme